MRTLARIALVASALLPLSAGAQALSEANPVITWTAGPFVVPNVTPQTGDPPVCLEYTATCSEYFFEISMGDSVDVENDQVRVSIAWAEANADFDPYLYACDASGSSCEELLVNGGGSANPESMYVPVRNGSWNGKYRVVVAPFLPLAQTFDGTVKYEKFEAQVGVKAAAAAPEGTRFDVYNPTEPYTGYAADEPTMGIDRNTNAVYMIYNSAYLETLFDDSTSPATATWNDVTGDGKPVVQLDPFMGDDEFPFADGTYWSRIWAVGFGLAISDIRFSDAPGTGVWSPSNTAAAGLPAGVDNESVASGPYPEGAAFDALRTVSETSGARGRAFYYCAHGAVNAFCIRSDNGGQTYNPGRAIFPAAGNCNNHGHVKVGADGTVYVPINNACSGGQGVSISIDAGETWTYLRILDANGTPFDSTSGSGRWDATIAIANDGKTLYFGYQDADRDEPYVVRGTLEKTPGPGGLAGTPKINWEKPVNVGRALGLRNVTFPTMVAGDPDRAAFAFHGTATEGDSGDPAFKGVWHMYVAMTYDGGATWEVNNINPSDPTQKGGFCDRGINCPSSPPYRNLLDFMDMVTDREGRVVVGHADGCIQNCITEKGRATYADRGALARQASGKPLFAKNDALFEGKTADGFATQAPVVLAQASHNAVRLSWKAPDGRGSAITGYRVYRSIGLGQPVLLATLSAAAGRSINGKPYFIDTGAVSGTTYGYSVTPVTADGLGRASTPVFATIERSATAETAPMPDTTAAADRPKSQAKAEGEESACVAPGLTVVEDGLQDGLNVAQLLPEQDIEWIAVSEPGALPGKIVLTLKVTALGSPLPPQHRWNVYFTTLDGTEWYASMANTDSPAAPVFEYGTTSTIDDVGAAPVGQLNKVGDLDATSGFTADGLITLVVDKAAVGIATGTPLDLIYAKTRATSTSEAGNAGVTRDDTATGFYDVIGNEACAKKARTVAAMEASDADGDPQFSGPSSLPNPKFDAVTGRTLRFDASATQFDDGVTAEKYVWSFGDGTPPVETASPHVTHTFETADAYRVTMHVIDSTGARSNTAKLTLLTGGKSGNGGMLNESKPFLFSGSLNLAALLGLLGLGALRARRRR